MDTLYFPERGDLKIGAAVHRLMLDGAEPHKAIVAARELIRSVGRDDRTQPAQRPDEPYWAYCQRVIDWQDDEYRHDPRHGG